MPRPSIAFFSQNDRLVELLTTRLDGRLRLQNCSTLADMREVLAEGEANCLVADFAECSGGGHAEVRLLETVQQQFPHTEIVMLTPAECPEPLERRATCTGITHLRNLDGDALAELLAGRASQPDAAVEVDETVASEISPAMHVGESEASRSIAHGFATHSPELRGILEELDVAARHDVIILLIGETGSGKTFLSRQIHDVSPRRDQPFLHVGCGALPSELIESELFGHVKGAFTSAHADKEGKFIAAGSGTILLDEIDALGPEQQMKLLRVIETGEFEPVGSNQTLRTRARLVVASNLELEPLVASGRFRPDLYYRLNMLKFELPPLRRRMADIDELVHEFVRRFSAKHGIIIRRIEPALFEALTRYAWPGNVRELENVVQRAVIYARDGVLSPAQLPSHIAASAAETAQDEAAGAPPMLRDVDEATLEVKMAHTERDLIEQALKRNNFSRTRTARELGVSRVTLYNKMKKFGMSG